MRRLLLLLLLEVSAAHALADALWQTLPPTPPPIAGEHAAHAKVNAISLYYATIGHGPPVVLLHGGLANSDYWGHQVTALVPRHTVILVDSRGHGRSTRDAQPLRLRPDGRRCRRAARHAAASPRPTSSAGATAVSSVSIWRSAIPDRVGRILAFAANTMTSGVQDGVDKNPTFARLHRASRPWSTRGCRRRRKDYNAFVAQISKMWETEPNWTDAQLKTIKTPVLVVDGDHDEAIRRDHTEYIAATIPGAGLLILPNTSHFAFLQDPARFNAAMLHFIDDR